MKNKIVRALIFGLGCLMLTLTISSSALNNNMKNIKAHVFQLDQEMPYGMIKSINTIHINVDMVNS